MGDKIIIDKDDLVRIADTVRLRTGSSNQLSIYDIFASLEDSLFLIIDEDGNELYATFTEQGTLADATANDIRLGKTAVTDSGLIEGEKIIPAYFVTEGAKYIPSGSEFTIQIENYAYTKLQAIICAFNSTIANSVLSEKVSINGSVYNVNSTEVLSTVSIDENNKTINLGLVNTGDAPRILRYFTYKEVL